MWKGILLTVAGMTVIAGVGAFGGYSYLSYQAQKLPDWFEKSSPHTVPIADNTNSPVNSSTPTALQVWQKVHQLPSSATRSAPGGGRWKQVDLTAPELNAVLFDSPATQQDSSVSLSKKVIKDSNVRIEDGKLTIGTVINVQSMTKELGNGQGGQALQAFSNLFGGNNANIYVEVEGKPVVAPNRTLGLEENSRIKVANINFTIAELAERTGISEDFLRDRLGIVSSKNPNVRGRKIVPMSVDTVEVVGNKLRLGGTGTAW